MGDVDEITVTRTPLEVEAGGELAIEADMDGSLVEVVHIRIHHMERGVTIVGAGVKTGMVRKKSDMGIAGEKKTETVVVTLIGDDLMIATETAVVAEVVVVNDQAHGTGRGRGTALEGRPKVGVVALVRRTLIVETVMSARLLKATVKWRPVTKGKHLR